MKLRYLDARHLDWLEQYTYKITRVDDIFKGFASHVNIKSTKRVVSFIHEGTPVIYGARGYKWLIFLPEDDNWCMTAVYDDKNRIVEWYFDITRQNFIGCEVPYFEDLYLDVVLNPKSGIKVLDEDELQEAFEKGQITSWEYEMALEVCTRLVNKIKSVEFISSFCGRCFAALSASPHPYINISK
ncbi:MAG: DUF402 domain-containing protein [Clostridiales bacterium]|jgi:predicted RNA-binding protein associated with RNAse of E/G family|nr:DUF402 domain-containing protein [Clostridiales bacterium]